MHSEQGNQRIVHFGHFDGLTANAELEQELFARNNVLRRFRPRSMRNLSFQLCGAVRLGSHFSESPTFGYPTELG
jgi:hypothetical protein